MKTIFTRVLVYSFYGIFIQIVLCNLLLATPPGVAQEVSTKEILLNLRLENADLLTVFKKIEEQTDFNFVYNSKDIDQQTILNQNYRKTSLYDILIDISKHAKLGFKRVNTNINVKKLPSGQFASVTEETATITVSGTITSKTDGEVLPGVNIIEKNSSNGTVTDIDGNYSISVDENAILIFSSIGFLTQEIEVNGRTTINASLSEDVQSLEEIVVVGYGVQERSDLTGAVSSVKAEDVKSLPVRSVSEALQGRAAGVQVTRNDGSPGGDSNIVIRGAGSIGGMPPLYIVDGVRMGTGNNFNMQDVESIEILKDASAAAIYGAQAAGGVVLVTTKRGAGKGKVNVDFNSYYGIREPRNLYDLLNTSDYITAKEAFGVNTNGWDDPSQLPNTDWVDELYTNGIEQSYSLSLSGSTEKTNYYLSANYQREDGTKIDNWFERYGIRSNTDYSINNRLKVGETLYAWKTATNPVQTATFPFRSAPVVAVHDETNPYGGWAKTGSFFTGPNLVGNEYIHHRKNETYALEGNIYLDWEVIDGLNFRSTFGASIYASRNYHFREAHDFGVIVNPIAFLQRDESIQKNFTGNYVLTYDKSIGLHQFKVMAGYESYQQDLSSLSGQAQGFQIITYNLGLSTDPSSNRTSGGEYPQTRLLSQFGRLNYSYDDKYLFTANIRRDGSDRFGPTNKWGVFPSFSVGWKLTEEAFLSNVTFLSNLKLRASYGILGSTSSIPQFTYQASYGGSGGTNIHGLPDGSRVKGYALTAQLANEDIKWEEVQQTDIGVDIGLFGDRLNITADWYSRQTQDMIYQVPVPLSSGFAGSSVYTNIGQMSNKGVEFAVDFRGRRGDFTYRIGANAAFNENLVKTLDGTNNNPINDGAAGDYLESTVARTEAGQPLSQYYGYIVDGIFQTDAEVTELNQQAREAGGSSSEYYQNQATGAGDLRFRDINGDGHITIEDKTFIGNPWPKMTYGINLNLGWKGFDLTALFQGVQGGDTYNGNKYYTQYFVGDYNTTADIFNTSFFNGGGLTGSPRVGFTDDSGNYVRDPNANYTRISSYYVEDGSYLKLRNLQIGYTFPNALTSRIGISNLRLYLQGQNLLTLTSYSGLDPEVLGRNGTTGRGIDTIYSYPRTRLFSVGIDLSF
ncbi:TonB-linked SusC/RagA family outer membrane protein [Catalinimonas alkaloidigena]|uniref:SusC/RagA family TonB-linked outer membrane protein n=1 Tax=Catalinimonas alkaloidigena TaxID=1075417 RepID=UPI0024050201|nr:TonB-dependent receptor [Catalinimonas alkaloidigena]MDF9796369.1 TonB-linked SusC/RagA family outer membrane protein [Catalinimonas alkaloidigena]